MRCFCPAGNVLVMGSFIKGGISTFFAYLSCKFSSPNKYQEGGRFGLFIYVLVSRFVCPVLGNEGPARQRCLVLADAINVMLYYY